MDCDNDDHNDFEVNFDDDDDEFNITDGEKELSDEDWKTQYKPCVVYTG